MKTIRTSLIALAFVAAIMLAKPARAQQSWIPAAADYPAVKVPAALKSEPVINSPLKAYFKTRIREGSNQGSNFGGHYALLNWGCGEGCTTFFIVDELTGRVYEPGFNLTAPKGGLDQSYGFKYQPDSRLIVMQGCRGNTGSCGTYYMLWTGSKLETLEREPLNTTVAALGGMQ